ncbi:MAG: hypothetical protein M1820_001723 [Bogoriella megaspora]|nr:MAG: hypothetical protein M1820_001723 [Bogoriella megaspora]
MAYAPRSPDLSGTYAPESPDLSGLTYAPRSPDLSAYQTATPLHPQHQGYRGSVSHDPYTPYTPFTPSDPRASGNTYFPPQPPLAIPSTESSSTLPFDNSAMVHAPAGSATKGRRRGKRASEGDDDFEWQPEEKKMKVENGGQDTGSTQRPNWAQGIDVRTKFPVARIKRIMQADEDVGKVAQVTPVVVSKALELFMIALVTKSASFAKNANSKRVTVAHLKQAVQVDEQFDFLGDIVAKVADAPVKSEADNEDEGAEGKPKRKTRAPTKSRRKKEDSESA